MAHKFCEDKAENRRTADLTKEAFRTIDDLGRCKKNGSCLDCPYNKGFEYQCIDDLLDAAADMIRRLAQAGGDV